MGKVQVSGETSGSPLCVRGAWTKVVEAETWWGQVAGLPMWLTSPPMVGYTARSESRPTVSRAECKPGEAVLASSAGGYRQLSTRPVSAGRLG